MDDMSSRREELIAAALAGELTEQEQVEFAAARAADPTMQSDLDDIRRMSDILRESGITWREEAPSPELTARIAETPEPAHSRSSARRRPARRFRPSLAVAAAALLIAGALGGLGLRALTEDGPVEGPPGTLGVVEAIDFARTPPGTTIGASVVAHTWGTETILQVDGLPAGKIYEVVLVGNDGKEVDAGTFIGSAVTVNCRVNAALLREDVAEVRIKAAGGAVVTASVLPQVS